MSRARLAVGVSGDVPLDRAACRRVSDLHAVIYYDEVSGQYELINYSPWGTLVNGVLYTCDVGRAAPAGPPAPAPAPAGPGAALARLALRSAGRRTIKLNGDITKPMPEEAEGGCRCAGSAGGPEGRAGAAEDPAGGAWEGAALLPHGAVLQFGCLVYVFCVTEPPAEP